MAILDQWVVLVVVLAARQLAQRMSGNIATVLPDRAERYFSTALM